MQKTLVVLLIIAVAAISCSRGVTPGQAACKSYKRCKTVL